MRTIHNRFTRHLSPETILARAATCPIERDEGTIAAILLCEIEAKIDGYSLGDRPMSPPAWMLAERIRLTQVVRQSRIDRDVSRVAQLNAGASATRDGLPILCGVPSPATEHGKAGYDRMLDDLAIDSAVARHIGERIAEDAAGDLMSGDRFE